MREIILDTETTGLNPNGGDRLIEIGCIELVNRIPSGREFHRFINPERDVPAEAEAVHGLSTAFLKDKPRFAASCRRVSRVHRRRCDRHPQCGVRRRLSELRARTAVARPHHHGPRDVHAAVGAAAASGGPQQPRRAVQALWHRQYQAHEARRPRRTRCCWPRSTSSSWACGRRRLSVSQWTPRHHLAPNSRRCSAATPDSVRRRSPRGCRRRWNPPTRRSSRRWARRRFGDASSFLSATLSSSWLRPRSWSAAPAGGADTATRNRTDRAAAAGSRPRASGRRRCGARTGTGSTGS